MTVCTDSVLNSARRAEKKARRDSSCQHKLVKDTADEAVMETTCPERTSTVTMKRESAKSMLMTIQSTGKNGPHSMKMRYTHLGACREGQGAFSLDPASEQCVKIRSQAAKMDPAKQCARSSEREACEQKVRDAAKQLSAMCG